MNDEYDLLEEQYADWPRPISKAVANNALAEFRESVGYNSLKKLPCAVCSGLCLNEHSTTVSVREINLLLLEANKDRFIERGIDGKNEDPFDLRICNSCNTSIFSLANMWIRTTPRYLQELMIPEQLLISTGYMCINLIQITNRKYTHHKIKGYVITFTQKLTSLSTILPLPLYRLCDRIKVVFVGEERLSEKQLKKVLCVRKNKIVTALEWLMDHNVLYKNIKLDKTALDSLPMNGVPTALLVTTVIVNVKPEKVEHYTRYVTDPIDENEMNNNLDNVDEEELSDKESTSELCDSTNNSAELRNSGMTYADGVPISEQERTLKLLEKLIQESTVEQISSHACDTNAALENT
ncbi:hypothetical protein Glove_173g84 [Diversispora epigaea]|uniref:DUF6570 domain-containing protein n=1 Tax=Diversispora epigaea TaxID=1348612 RepID=A0A397ITX5_9GLOM|nr:hypothetical protein Glove_173g84 [Diversispora epigaea]